MTIYNAPDGPTVGRTVTLPDGTMVRVTVPADPDRPWMAVELANQWQVCRMHYNEMWAGASHYFGGEKSALRLTEENAKALAKLLNQAV